ncbi:MAG: hypothetical protein ACE5Q6_27535 [Dehalococcoidia bacterium]
MLEGECWLLSGLAWLLEPEPEYLPVLELAYLPGPVRSCPQEGSRWETPMESYPLELRLARRGLLSPLVPERRRELNRIPVEAPPSYNPGVRG